MKIAVVNATPRLGGAGLIAKDVARGMASRGHDVRFISTAKTASQGFDADLGCHQVLVPTGPQSALAHYVNPVATAALARELARFEPDVVNFHNVNLRTFSASSLLLSRRWTSAWTLHDVWPVCMTGWPEPPDCQGMHRGCQRCPTWPDWQTRTNRLLKDLIFAQARLTVVCPSQWMADTVASSALGRHPTAIVRNGVDTALFARRDDARAELGIAPEAVVMVFSGGRRVSGTSPAFRKGWDDLRAALGLLGKRDKLELLYVGDPIDLPADFPVPVTFTGGVERTRMPHFYSAADICVLPTLGDNAPLGVLEAMSVGTAIVATHVGGIPEVLEDGRSARLCPARNPKALADALGAVLDDKSHRQELAQTAHRHLHKSLTLEHMLGGYEALFERLGGAPC